MAGTSRTNINPYLATPSKRTRETDPWEGYRSIETESTPTSRTTTSGGATPTQSKQARKRMRKAVEKRRKEEEEYTSRFPGLDYLGRTLRTRDLDKELKFAEEDPLFKQFWLENEALFEGVTPEDWCFVEANSVVELNHLERFDREYTPLKKEYEKSVELAADYVAHLLRLPEKIPFPTKGDLEAVRYNGSKYSGFEYAIRDFKTRSAANQIAQQEAELAWDELMNGQRVAPHVNRIGGRGKLTTKKKLEASKEKPVAGRLVFMTSHRDLKLNGVTEQLLTKAYKPNNYPISVGKTWWHGGVVEFVDRFAGFEMYSCFDASKFDSSLPPWLIRLALDILRDQFEDGWNKEYDAYWEFVFEGLVYAPVYLDNGMQFRRKGGSTSGHSFNTLMQSICTLIIGYTGFFHLRGHENAEKVTEEVWIEALGDDQHTGAKGDCAKYTIEDLAPIAMDCFGVDWWGDKSFNTGTLVDLSCYNFQGTQYLGKYFRQLDDQVGGIAVQSILPYRPFEETCLRLLYPERGETGVTESWMRALGHYADNAGNPRVRGMLEIYLDWLEPQVTDDEVVWNEKWARKFTGGDPLAPVPVPGKRMYYEDWLGLVLLDDTV